MSDAIEDQETMPLECVQCLLQLLARHLSQHRDEFPIQRSSSNLAALRAFRLASTILDQRGRRSGALDWSMQTRLLWISRDYGYLTEQPYGCDVDTLTSRPFMASSSAEQHSSHERCDSSLSFVHFSSSV